MSMCPTRRHATLCLVLFLTFCSTPPVHTRASLRTYWSSLLSRALELSRDAKWNEFIEESHKASKNSGVNRSSGIDQSLIDETKDPNSPYYISMISSNIGSNHHHQPLNRTAAGNSSDNQTASAWQLHQSAGGTINKLFTYAFSTAAPSRFMQTTKRPLVTYINVSNLEEHDSETPVKYNSVADSTASSLQLLNNADSNTASLQMKRRLPECATQQVCSAHYVKSNHTQRLCDCPHDFNWNCEDALPTEDHVMDLTKKQEVKTQRNSLEAYTQVKLCESLRNIKPCKSPTDWTIMALQSERTGKAHYVVVCRCPDSAQYEGPFTHKHPPYARFPGIRVYGMLCNQGIRKSKYSKAMEIDQNNRDFPEFPWELAYAVINSTTIQGFW